MAKNKLNQNIEKGEDIPFYKKDTFVLYRTWLSLPGFLKGKDVLSLEKAGIDDPDMVDLLSLKTQKQFAERFGVDPQTLVVWNKYIYANYDIFEEVRAWSTKLIKNVVGATYNSALQRDPKANADRKLFLQLQGWVEKSEQTVNQVNLTELLKQKLANAYQRERDRKSKQ